MSDRITLVVELIASALKKRQNKRTETDFFHSLLQNSIVPDLFESTSINSKRPSTGDLTFGRTSIRKDPVTKHNVFLQNWKQKFFTHPVALFCWISNTTISQKFVERSVRFFRRSVTDEGLSYLSGKSMFRSKISLPL